MAQSGEVSIVDNSDGVVTGRESHTSQRKMQHHPTRSHLFKRVKLLTAAGEHAEALALYEDLMTRKHLPSHGNKQSRREA